MRDTPRTDWEAGYYDGSGCWKYTVNGECVRSDFARTLERELNAANKRIKRLVEAGDLAAECCEPTIFDSGRDKYQKFNAKCAWFEAKGAKQ